MAPFGPSEHAAVGAASGGEASAAAVASDVPASSGASQCSVSDAVATCALHEAPAGIGQSPAARVMVTGPGAVHVKVVDDPLADEKVPLGADHAYVSAPGFGPLAVAESAIEPPTVVSDGLAETPATAAQS